MTFQEALVQSIMRYIIKRTQEKARHEDILYEEIYESVKHLRAWYDPSELFVEAINRLKAQGAIEVDRYGYIRRAEDEK